MPHATEEPRARPAGGAQSGRTPSARDAVGAARHRSRCRRAVGPARLAFNALAFRSRRAVRAARLVALALALLLGACREAEREAPAVPAARTPAANALLVVIDTLRADHLGCYGDDRGLTPHLDALAAEGVVFETAVASSSWTRSSMASLFTGRYPQTIGVYDKQDAIAGEIETLAETLSAAGVATLGLSTNRNAGRAHGFDAGFDLWVDDLPRTGYPDDFAMVSAEEVTRAALSLLDQRDPNRPLFSFLHYTDPHDPYLPHPGLLTTPEPPGRFDGSRRALRELDQLSADERTDDDTARIRWLYAGEVAWCDRWLGPLFDGLRERGLWDEMLVIVTADHGEGLWDHEVRGHGEDLYEEQVHVPLLVKSPTSWGVAPARADALVGHVDLAPTVIDAFGLAPSAEAQGQPLVGAPGRADGGLGFAYGYSELRKGGHDMESLRDAREKLVRDRRFDGDRWRDRTHVTTVGDTLAGLSREFFGAGRVQVLLAANPQLGLPADTPPHAELPVGVELVIPDRQRDPADLLYQRYDLRVDPGERRDLAKGPLPEDTPLVAMLRRFATENIANAVAGAQVRLEDLDPETLEALRGLGYVGN